MRRTSAVGRFASIGCAVCLAACAAPIRHEYRLAPGRAHTPEQSRALLIPINESAQIPKGLEKGEAEVFACLVGYLQGRGLRVQTLETPRYRDAAAAALQTARRRAETGHSTSVSGSASYGDVVPLLLEELDTDADLVVVPIMVLRDGESIGHTVIWDGVRRTDPGVGARSRVTGTGRTGVSLLVAVYDRDGTSLFTGYGGLDLVFSANLKEARFDLIEDRLEDLENLREGVCVAFHPYFGEDVRCR